MLRGLLIAAAGLAMALGALAFDEFNPQSKELTLQVRLDDRRESPRR